MKTFIDNLIAWIKANIWLAIGILAVVTFVLFPRQLKKMLGLTPHRVKHRKTTTTVTRRRRSLPRSVGMRKRNKPTQYNKSGKAKKPWQIKGSLAAKRHMAQIRRMR